MSSGTGLTCACVRPRIFTYASKVATSRASMCQSGPERKNMPRGMFVFQKSSVLPTTVTGTPRYFAYAAVAIPYGPAPMTKSAFCAVSILDHPLRVCAPGGQNGCQSKHEILFTRYIRTLKG